MKITQLGLSALLYVYVRTRVCVNMFVSVLNWPLKVSIYTDISN